MYVTLMTSNAGLFTGRALVSRCRILALGQAVAAIVHHNVDHVQVAPHRVGELAHADRRCITIAGDTQVQQVPVGHRGTRHHRRHAAVNRIKAVRLAQKIGWRFGGTANTRQLGDLVRRYGQFVHRPTCLGKRTQARGRLL